MKYFLSAIICIMLSSCSLFYKVAFGIKNPKFESYNSINKYSTQLEIDSSRIVFSKDTLSNTKLIHFFGGYQDILIFNHDYKYLPYKDDSVSCNASVDTIFKRICNIENNSFKTKRDVNYTEFISLIDDYNNVMSDIKSQNYDFIIFADYAKFFPSVNKNHIPYWDHAIKTHRGNCKVKMIYINLDYLSSWNIPKKFLPTLNLSSNKK